ncbi:MAG: ATP-binding cassette domain-containing protein [Saprospiraceae bacterium]
MSVKVTQLVKTYGSQHAVDSISFEARKGEVLGFLGPNGAGKTTTMKVVTGYLPPSSGEVEVCDFNVVSNPMDSRACIGYLPEHNPLYKEMFVKEYLAFTAGLHNVKNPVKKIAEMIDRTGLSSHAQKRIGELSRDIVSA